MEFTTEQAIKSNIEAFEADKAKEVIPTPANILDELRLDKALKLASKLMNGLITKLKIYQDILNKFPKNKALAGMKTLASKTLAANSDIRPLKVAQFAT